MDNAAATHMDNAAALEASCSDYTALQRHVAFFDRNKDGIVYPSETFSGFRAIGFNVLISAISALVINLTLSYHTLESWVPSLLLPIYIKNIKKAKHTSDSGLYDAQGRFLPHEFENFFIKYAKSKPDFISEKELIEMRRSFKKQCDAFGQLASKFEWQFAYTALKDEHGYVSKESLKGVFDGTIFFYLEEKKLHNKS